MKCDSGIGKRKAVWFRVLCAVFGLAGLVIILSGCGSSSLPSPSGIVALSEALVDTSSNTDLIAVLEAPIPPEVSVSSAVESLQTPTPTAAPTPTIAPSPAATPLVLSRALSIHVIDVGQGDSILIQLPNGQNMLIDAGESAAASTVKNYLTDSGVETIDYLVATHPHADHIGGLPSIIESFEVKSVYMPRVSHTTQAFENLLSAIDSEGLGIDTAKAGVSILSEPGLQVDIIAPVRDDYDSLNDHSAVIRIVYGATSFILMGDAETLSEGHITADVSADMLKVGHHGSNTSTSQAFLDRVSPTYAVISCGAGNSYGHPTDETLKRLDTAGVSVFRTDLQGTLVFTSDGTAITVSAEPTQYQPPSTPTPTPTPTVTPTPAATPKPEPSPEPTPEPPASDTMVWLSATGAKYHAMNNCGRMNPDKATQVTVAEAKNKGFGPCGNCKPSG